MCQRKFNPNFYSDNLECLFCSFMCITENKGNSITMLYPNKCEQLKRTVQIKTKINSIINDLINTIVPLSDAECIQSHVVRCPEFNLISRVPTHTHRTAYYNIKQLNVLCFIIQIVLSLHLNRFSNNIIVCSNCVHIYFVHWWYLLVSDWLTVSQNLNCKLTIMNIYMNLWSEKKSPNQNYLFRWNSCIAVKFLLKWTLVLHAPLRSSPNNNFCLKIHWIS